MIQLILYIFLEGLDYILFLFNVKFFLKKIVICKLWE